MMQLKDTFLQTHAQIASYAKDTLKNTTYHLLSYPYKDMNFVPTKTQCALLIWQVFYHFGYD